MPPATVDLTSLFAPRGVAVLGASRNPAKLGHRLVQNLLASGFAGDVFPVNPSGEAILGLEVVTRAEDVPRALDLALVSLPAPAVLPAVRVLGARGCRVCVILASGFGETGRAGRGVQEEIGAIARATGMRIVGPNCMGVVNVPGRLNASYFWDVPRQPGVISFVSQSGAYGGLFFREVRERSLGVAKFLSIGNQADLGFTECLAWLADDPDTRVVGLFVEGIRDGRAFVAAARRLARGKPVVALKGGRAEAGRRAAGSHTGSLAGAWETYRAAFAAAGIVVVEGTEELFDAHGDPGGARKPPAARRGRRGPHHLGRAVRRGGRRGGSGGPPRPGPLGRATPVAADPPAGFWRRREPRRHDAPDGARRLRAERAPGPRGARGFGGRRDRHRPRPPRVRGSARSGAGRDRQARRRVHRRHSGHGPSSPHRRHPARAGTGARGAGLRGTRPSRGALPAGRDGPRASPGTCPVRRSRRPARHEGFARACGCPGTPGGLRRALPA